MSPYFQLLAQDQWQVRCSNCSFAQHQLSYLGHIISEVGVSIDPNKIQAITFQPQPTNVKDLRDFLGLASYYRRFIHQFAVLAKLLTELLN